MCFVAAVLEHRSIQSAPIFLPDLAIKLVENRTTFYENSRPDMKIYKICSRHVYLGMKANLSFIFIFLFCIFVGASFVILGQTRDGVRHPLACRHTGGALHL